MILRPWKYEDILSVAELEERCFSAERWNFAMFASAFTEPTFAGIILQEDGKTLGYACASCVMDECDLLTIAVAKEERGKGYGKKLLNELIKTVRTRGARKMFLEVRRSNAVAISLYAGVGFVKVGERKRYYPDGEDALVLVREL